MFDYVFSFFFILYISSVHHVRFSSQVRGSFGDVVLKITD